MSGTEAMAALEAQDDLLVSRQSTVSSQVVGLLFAIMAWLFVVSLFLYAAS